MRGMASRPRNHLLWIGPVLTFVGVWSYFTVAVRWPALRDGAWLNVAIAGLGIALAALGTVRAFTRGSRVPVRLLGTLGLAVSILFGGFLGAYVFVLSYGLPPPSGVSTGLAAAPDVELLDADGRPFRLASLRGTRVVLVFYRGHW